MTTPEREKFEKWYADNKLKGVNVETWEAWQAALSAAPAPPEQADKATPFGSSELLQQSRDLCHAIERLPSGEHQSKMISLAGDLAFAMQNLQMNGDHFWPRPVPTPPEVEPVAWPWECESLCRAAEDMQRAINELWKAQNPEELDENDKPMDLGEAIELHGESWRSLTEATHYMRKRITAPPFPKAEYDAEGNPLNLMAAAKDALQILEDLQPILGIKGARNSVIVGLREFIGDQS